MTLLVRAASEQDNLIAAVRRELQAVDRNVPLTAVKPVAAKIDEDLSTERLLTSLLAAFGLFSALLAAIGLYGVTAYSVARRRHEIAVRMALGATRACILRALLAEVVLLPAIGLAAGLPAALGLARLARSLLYGIAPADAPALAGASVLPCAVAVLAGCLPARRATRIDPAIALRHD
jgi:ABC-type antimicrobial peptide transport system permease subunit